MNRVLLLCAAIATVPAAAGAQTAAPPAPAPQTQATPASTPPADHAGHANHAAHMAATAAPAPAAEKEVCKMSKPAGSHVRRVKTCMRASDWQRQQNSARDDIRRAQESARPQRDR